MATRTVSFHTLICDGCTAQFGLHNPFASLIEARAAAYHDGWRFPERTRASRGESKTVDDVCPACATDWHPRLAPNPHAARKGGNSGG